VVLVTPSKIVVGTNFVVQNVTELRPKCDTRIENFGASGEEAYPDHTPGDLDFTTRPIFAFN
jgi:hypothetical protein